MPLEIGLLGATEIARLAMIEPARRLTGVRIRSIAARDPRRAHDFAEAQGVPVVHATYDALVADPALDAVYVSLHNAAHAAWAATAAMAGKHVIVEKPLCLTPAEAGAIAAAARVQRVQVIEAVMTARHPWSRRVRSIAATGELGTLVEMRTRLGFTGGDPTGYRFDPELGGGVLHDTAPYWLEAVDAVIGLDGAKPSGRCERAGPGGVDLAVTARLAWTGGPAATLDATFGSGTAARHDLRFEHGTISVKNLLAPAAAPLPLNLVVTGPAGRRVEQLAPLCYYDEQLSWIVAEIAHGRPGAALSQAAVRVAVMDAVGREIHARTGTPG